MSMSLKDFIEDFKTIADAAGWDAEGIALSLLAAIDAHWPGSTESFSAALPSILDTVEYLRANEATPTMNG